MPEQQKFQRVQQAFAAHLRNPDKHNAPSEIEDRRMAVYRELIYNNINGFIESGFPVINSLLNEQEWHSLIRQFIDEHKATSPYFSEVAKEFLLFLEQKQPDIIQKYPFIIELAHYEWVELALMIDPFEASDVITKDSVDLLNEPLLISPVAWPLAYEYDVQHISSDYLPDEKPAKPTFIVVYRNRADDVEFTEINAVTFALLELIKQNSDKTGGEVLNLLAEQLPQFPAETIKANGLDILMKLMKRDIILGVIDR